MNPHFFNDDIAPDASRTFRPITTPKPDRFGLWITVAALLIAVGSALYLGVFR